MQLLWGTLKAKQHNGTGTFLPWATSSAATLATSVSLLLMFFATVLFAGFVATVSWGFHSLPVTALNSFFNSNSNWTSLANTSLAALSVFSCLILLPCDVIFWFIASTSFEKKNRIIEIQSLLAEIRETYLQNIKTILKPIISIRNLFVIILN